MTLLITVFSAVICTVLWYTSDDARRLRINVLLYMFWGASLMWFVDSVVEYFESGDEFFNPSATDMLNDAFLGFSAVAFALIVWVIVLFVKKPIIQNKN